MANATGLPADSTWQRWKSEYEQAGKAKGFKTWQSRSKKIIKRYRDERTDAQNDNEGEVSQGTRFNILWSNVQTLMPALYGKTPKPVVERRYLDRDDVGRVASVILERALMYELDDGTYSPSLRKAVLDRLLPGRGVIWVRYDAKFRDMEPKTQETGDNPDPSSIKTQEEPADKPAPEPQEEVASESVPVDYIDWRDFTTSPSRTWEEVTWIDKRVYMTRKELIARFGKKIGEKVTLDWSPASDVNTPNVEPTPESKKAKVHETWCKTDRKVYWWAESWSEAMLDEKDDPLKLENFWPVPKPLYATLTNDSLVPVPDFYEYQDQANELDDLTARISALTKAIKNAGIYDASVPELRRMFEEGFENQLVPCDNMSNFSDKAGPNGMGAIWLLPIKDMAGVLQELYLARDQVKQTLYEITGISDIVRGQQTGGNATATEQRIKGQFASMRLNDMQSEVARFARDTLRIMGEIIAEHFDPMTLFLISGYEQYAQEQFPPEDVAPPAPPQNPMMGHNGGPPMGGGLMQAPPGAPPGVGAAGGEPAPPGSPAGPLPIPNGGMPAVVPPDPVVVAQQKAAETFKKAVELLRNDKLRGFRVEIETDSIVEPDQQATQQARTELLSAVAQFLPQAMQAGAATPAMKPLLGQLLLFFLRGFKAGRDLEAPFEQFIDDMKKEAKNPPPQPPSPEQIKAQAEIQKQQMENERAQAEFQMDQQRAAMDLQSQQQKNAMDMEKAQADLAIKREELNLKREEMAMKREQMQLDAQMKERQAAMDIGLSQQKADIEAQSMDRQASLAEEADARAAEGDQRKHDLAIETAEAKAAMAKKPKPAGEKK